jgi:hypothetical protein
MRRVLVVLVVLVGCGGGSSGSRSDAGVLPDGDVAVADAGPQADAMPLEGQARGRVWVTEVAGTVDDLDMISAVWAEFGMNGFWYEVGEPRIVVASVGQCAVLRRQPALCDPPCPGNWYCGAEDVCVFGYGVDAGDVTVTGVVGGPRVLGYGTQYHTVDEPDDLFAAGDIITATSVGATIPAFSLQATGVEPLDVVIPDGIVTLSDASDTILTWTPSSVPGARFRLYQATPHGHAGTSEYALVCEGPDLGFVTITAELAAHLPPLQAPNCFGLTCTVGTLSRFTRGEADGIELLVGSTTYFWTRH